MVSWKVFEEVEKRHVLHYQANRKALWDAGIEREKEGGPPFNALAYGDLESIIWTRQKWRAMRASWEIVVSRRAEIALLAKTLIKHGKATQPPRIRGKVSHRSPPSPKNHRPTSER